MTDGDAHDLRTLSDVLDELEGAGDGRAVSVDDVLEACADRSLGALLTVLGALTALPLVGAIPSVSIVIAALVVLACLRSFVGGGSLRLPGAVGARDRRGQARARRRARPALAARGESHSAPSGTRKAQIFVAGPRRIHRFDCGPAPRSEPNEHHCARKHFRHGLLAAGTVALLRTAA